MCSFMSAHEKFCAKTSDAFQSEAFQDVPHTKKRILPNWDCHKPNENGDTKNGDDYDADDDDSSSYESDSSDSDSSSYDSDSDDLQFAFDEDLKGFEDKSDLNAWERQRLFRRLIKGIEELKKQLAQEQLDLLSASDAVAIAATKAINERTADLEKNICAMQSQLDTIEAVLNELHITTFNVQKQLLCIMDELVKLTDERMNPTTSVILG